MVASPAHHVGMGHHSLVVRLGKVTILSWMSATKNSVFRRPKWGAGGTHFLMDPGNCFQPGLIVLEIIIALKIEDKMTQ